MKYQHCPLSGRPKRENVDISYIVKFQFNSLKSETVHIWRLSKHVFPPCRYM